MYFLEKFGKFFRMINLTNFLLHNAFQIQLNEFETVLNMPFIHEIEPYCL